MSVIITGAESSGTRYLTRLVSAMGVDAVHRSIPHNSDWAAWRNGDPHIFIARDWHATALSQVEHGHARDYRRSLERIRRAYRDFFRDANEFYVVTYQALVDYPQQVMDEIADFLEVRRRPVEEMPVDANAARFSG